MNQTDHQNKNIYPKAEAVNKVHVDQKIEPRQNRDVLYCAAETRSQIDLCFEPQIVQTLLL